VDPDALDQHFSLDPEIIKVVFIDQACTADGWQQIAREISDCPANRVLIGACHPYVFLKKIRELAQTVHLDSSLMNVADIMAPVFRAVSEGKPEEKKDIQATGVDVFSALNSGVESMKRMEPINPQPIPIVQKVLVIGGGIAGMTAALAIADAGYGVDLIEKSDRLGGNLNWLNQTIDGLSLADFLTDTVDAVEKHPLVNLFLNSRLISFEGSAGQFYSTIENEEQKAVDVTHGAVILATGGHEANTAALGYGTHEAIVTQKELEIRLAENQIDPAQTSTVVMIQCVDSRQGARNYCSRVCCPTALKQARHLKQLNPEADIYILYRDMMTCGFSESFFTRARNDGVIFMTYDRENPPSVDTGADQITVSLTEPILKMPVEISADLVVLATGIVPDFSDDLASLLGISKDSNGFFQEAESKWRPLDAMKEGIFACGIVHSPRSATEAADTGRAAAQRAIRLISNPAYIPDKTVAIVRHSLCSLCERCIDACPYGARMFNLDHTRIQVNELMCQGCGACAAICPNNASVLPGHSGRLMLGAIDAVFEQLHN